ncbi:FKBP-type peptidyl-prolyl cis-trans isomerase [Xylanimonas sp. McL0601]|uniref:FKBP-type peptidyl-prolyl cis-trans isomerase n=1 Tax=Xylanimonas sp. McL0601 TaxID=3414739 RepID=UPI003CEE735E
MNLRISAGAAVLALAAALALSGCSSDSSNGSTPSPSPTPSPSSTAAAGNPTPTAQDVAALAGVKVEGKAGAEPTLSFDKPFTVSVPTTRSLEKGTGDALKEGQLLRLHYVMYQGDGTRLGSSWKEGKGKPESIVLGDKSLGVINDALSGAKVGARALVANPTASKDGTTTTLLMLMEVASVGAARAEGEAVTPAAGLPTVTLADNGEPSIKIPSGYAAPKDLVVQPLIKGSGAAVTAEQTVTVQYTGWTFDGKSFDSSWTNGSPATFQLSQVIKGWTNGLAGQTVGSQVLLVIPADQAYGAEKSDSNALAGQPLVFVVDILDAQ